METLSANSVAKPGANPFLVTGKWDFSTLAGYSPEANTLWTREKGATAIWFPLFPGKVLSRVFLHFPKDPKNNDSEAIVEVKTRSETISKTITSTEMLDGWLFIGQYTFLGGNDEYIKIRKVSNSGILRASASRFDILGNDRNSILQSLYVDKLTLPDENRLSHSPTVALVKNHAGGPPMDRKWTLSFSDEFNEGTLSEEKWSTEDAVPTHIASSRKSSNIRLADGCLILNTTREIDSAKPWSTAHLWTRIFRQEHGYFEARIRTSSSSGLNNAFWLMPEPISSQDGEIDVVEASYPNRIQSSLHLNGNIRSRLTIASASTYDNFHIYAVDWTAKKITWLVDGQEIFVLPAPAKSIPAAIRFSTAVASFAGNITPALDGTHMDIDWLRVYSEKH